MLDIQREKLQNKFLPSNLKEEDKKIIHDAKKPLDPRKRNILFRDKKIVSKKSNTNVKIVNLGGGQYKPSFGETLKRKNLPEFPSSPFGDEFPVNTNFKFSTLLPGTRFCDHQ